MSSSSAHDGAASVTGFERILITGATGFVGRHLLPVLRIRARAELFPVGSADADLRDAPATRALFESLRPDAVIHLAALSGGIIDNRARPVEYFEHNLAINLNTFQAARELGVRKLVAFMGGCSYPADARSPIGEAQMWRGFPQPDSAGYATAKLAMAAHARACHEQRLLETVVLVPGNLYGEHDRFELERAHVIPALIRRMVEARDQGLASVTVLGSGRPTRDFVYAGDVAELVPWFLEHRSDPAPLNLSTGRATSIRELAGMLRAIVGFEGEIVWDPSAPDGQLHKIFDCSKLGSLGLSCPTLLEDGLRRTVEWYDARTARP